MMSLNEKVVLITGAARRLGRTLALALAKDGASIAIHYHSSEKEAKSLLKELKVITKRSLDPTPRVASGLGMTSQAAAGLGMTSQAAAGLEMTHALFQANLTRVSEINRMIQKILRHFGRIDVLINNASVFYPTPFGKTTEKEWDLFMNTNLKAPFFCAQAVVSLQKKRAQHLKLKRPLKIINILDASGPKTRGNYLPYWISKTGLSAMTETLAKIFLNDGRSDITVNGIAPGPILFSEDRKKFRREITIDPLDIVSAVRYILQDKNTLTGNVLILDKGRRYLL